MTRHRGFFAAACVLAAVAGCDLTVQAGAADGGPDAATVSGDGGTTPVNTPVTLGGYTLQPRSAIMAASIGSFPGDAGVTGRWILAIVSDYLDVCAGFGCVIGGHGMPEGTHLAITIYGTALEAYPIGAVTGSASVQFLRAGAGGTSLFRDVALSGTVTLESFSDNGQASGQYDLTMQSGAVIRGTFVTGYCKGLTLSIPMGGVSCAEAGTTASCDNPCTCEGKTVRAACVSTGTNTWSCNCTSPTGASTTCTMSGPAAVPAERTACWEYGTCCPMSF